MIYRYETNPFTADKVDI